MQNDIGSRRPFGIHVHGDFFFCNIGIHKSSIIFFGVCRVLMPTRICHIPSLGIYCYSYSISTLLCRGFQVLEMTKILRRPSLFKLFCNLVEAIFRELKAVIFRIQFFPRKLNFWWNLSRDHPDQSSRILRLNSPLFYIRCTLS
jgi:hypothetical protein